MPARLGIGAIKAIDQGPLAALPEQVLHRFGGRREQGPDDAKEARENPPRVRLAERF
ncbi:MAG TPA: hypothetical protein VIE89_06365 [Candidatus Binatia bacterium]